MKKPVAKKKTTKKPAAGTTDVTIILDRSGSMSSIWDATIKGYNTFLADQRKLKDKACLSLVQFDNEYEVHQSQVDMREAPALNRDTFIPRGSTALLDAIGKTIDTTGERLALLPARKRPARVIMVIMTDGAENCSREYSRDKVFSMITHQRSKYNWEFVFIGANQDAIAEGAKMGINLSVNYTSNAVGTASAFAGVTRGLTSYRSGGGYTTP